MKFDEINGKYKNLLLTAITMKYEVYGGYIEFVVVNENTITLYGERSTFEFKQDEIYPINLKLIK